MVHTNKITNGWREISEQIRKRISDGEFAPGQKLPSEADLANEIKVAKLTVKRAYAKLVSDGIARTVERVGTFVAEDSATKVRRIGLILPTSDGFLEFGLLAGIRGVLDSDAQLILYATDNDDVTEHEVLQAAEGNVDGILIMSSCHPKVIKRLEKLNASGCPVVCLDRSAVGSPLASVTTDNYSSTRIALEDLYRRGHRKIAYFGCYDSRISSVADRFRAFCDFAQEFGMGEPADLARFTQPRSPDELFLELPIFRDSIQSLTSEKPPITAAFCANEHYLYVLTEILQEFPATVDRSFELAAFCDWPRLASNPFNLELIRQDVREIGRSSAQLLLDALVNKTAATGQIRVPAKIQVVPSIPSSSHRPAPHGI